MTSPIAGVTGYTPAATTAATTQTNASTTASKTDNSQLSSKAFLQLLVAQLQYQDPTKPVDTAALMSQTATLNQIQTMEQLSTASTAQTQAQQVQTATNMVGHTVSYTAANGKPATGYVSAATITGTAPSLTIGGSTVALTNVQQVLAGTTPTA